MREFPHRQERTEPIREPEVPLQGLWGLSGPGTQGPVHGRSEGPDLAGLSGTGQSAGIAPAVWCLYPDGPGVGQKRPLPFPW
jgi:hypothetical protein